LRSACAEFFKWVFPFIFAGIGWWMMSVGLHMATYFYIQKYAKGISATSPAKGGRFSILKDVEDYIPKFEAHVTLDQLDMVAAFFPGIFCLATFTVAIRRCCAGKKDPEYRRALRQQVLQLWTKVMICASFLFLFKGIVGAVTTIPDSSGWKVCADRLKTQGVDYMQEQKNVMSFFYVDFWWPLTWWFPKGLAQWAAGAGDLEKRKGMLRYCSDMMYSGHTFTVTLFALGFYEMVRLFNVHRFGRFGTITKIVVLVTIGTLSVLEQILEIALVEETRFHYTTDVIVALVLTFLFYTNGPIVIVAKCWADHGFCIWHWNKKECVPPEEKYLCESNILDNGTLTEEELDEMNALVSRADILVPPCCVPFCCLAGREHIYSDNQLKKLIKLYAKHSKMFGEPDHEPNSEHVNYSRDYQEVKEVLFNKRDTRKVMPKNKNLVSWEMFCFLKGEMSIGQGVSLGDVKEAGDDVKEAV
jgi:hypothetical protein